MLSARVLPDPACLTCRLQERNLGEQREGCKGERDWWPDPNQEAVVWKLGNKAMGAGDVSEVTLARINDCLGVLDK